MNVDRPRQATVSYFGLCGLLLIVIFSENVKEKGLNVKKIPARAPDMGKLPIMPKIFVDEFGNLCHQETSKIRFNISSGVMLAPSTLLRVWTLRPPGAGMPLGVSS